MKLAVDQEQKTLRIDEHIENLEEQIEVKISNEDEDENERPFLVYQILKIP